jgi:phage terminase small subunit
VSFNAYQAALLAGYSENTARKAEILHIPMVQTYLREVMNKATARAEITHELLLNEYRKIAFANMGDYFDFRGNNKRMCELTDDEKAALSYYHIADITEDDGFVRGQVCKIKLHNKMAALDRIARHLNFFNVPAAKVSATVPEVAVPDTTADDAFEAALENQESGIGNQEGGVES